MNKSILFRADASHVMGTGHVMRCLTLAIALRKVGYRCLFVMRKLPNSLDLIVKNQGFEVLFVYHSELGNQTSQPTLDSSNADFETPWTTNQMAVDWAATDAALSRIGMLEIDWIVVDHYKIASKWHKLAKSKTRAKIMVIDDLANRHHECSLLLDQSIGRVNSDYDRYLPTDCHQLVGAQNSLLRTEFSKYRAASLEKRDQRHGLNRILISMGGGDPYNECEAVLKLLENSSLNSKTKITLVHGASSHNRSSVQLAVSSSRFCIKLLNNSNQMARLMAKHDLAFGTAGGTSWERCCMGLPSLTVITANNQSFVAKGLQDAGAALCFMSLTNQDARNHCAEALESLIFSPNLLKIMSCKASKVTDGTGTKKVVETMMYITAGSS